MSSACGKISGETQRENLRMRTAFVSILAVTLSWLSGSWQAHAVSIAFEDPAGGWSYAYLGAGVTPGTTAGNDFTALDGTWDRQNGSDEWDGGGLGGTLGDGNRPGGISALTAGTTDFIRLQDVGNPTQHGFPDPSSNRKIYPGHNIGTDPGIASPDTIGASVTLSFRARVATAATGIIDSQYPDTGGTSENSTVAAGTSWPANGSGLLGHDGGKGMFNIRESSANDNTARPGRGVLSFSLSLASDTRSDGMPFGSTGLTMNSLNGMVPSGTVDPYQNEGMINVLPIADLTQFHEFWITIQADQSGGGTHKVDVYVDGSETPNTFHVTSGTGNDYGGLSYIAMGAGATPQQAAYDVDFFAYKEGIHLPGGPLVDGDVDGDGIGGEYPEDFLPIQMNFRKLGNRGMGDLSGNGTVDFPDFREWKTAHVGMGGSLAGLDLGVFGGNIPEPSTTMLLLATFAALAPCRWGRHGGKSCLF
jgi:hypothetical protein